MDPNLCFICLPVSDPSWPPWSLPSWSSCTYRCLQMGTNLTPLSWHSSQYWYPFWNRLPSTCFWTWSACLFTCLRVSKQKYWFLVTGNTKIKRWSERAMCGNWCLLAPRLGTRHQELFVLAQIWLVYALGQKLLVLASADIRGHIVRFQGHLVSTPFADNLFQGFYTC